MNEQLTELLKTHKLVNKDFLSLVFECEKCAHVVHYTRTNGILTGKCQCDLDQSEDKTETLAKEIFCMAVQHWSDGFQVGQRR